MLQQIKVGVEVEPLPKKEVSSPNSFESDEGKKLATVRSAGTLLKPAMESPGGDEPNISDEYLKSQRPNKSSSKVKRSAVR